jgi:hypothetical protein
MQMAQALVLLDDFIVDNGGTQSVPGCIPTQSVTSVR